MFNRFKKIETYLLKELLMTLFERVEALEAAQSTPPIDTSSFATAQSVTDLAATVTADTTRLTTLEGLVGTPKA